MSLEDYFKRKIEELTGFENLDDDALTKLEKEVEEKYRLEGTFSELDLGKYGYTNPERVAQIERELEAMKPGVRPEPCFCGHKKVQ